MDEVKETINNVTASIEKAFTLRYSEMRRACLDIAKSRLAFNECDMKGIDTLTPGNTVLRATMQNICVM